jgi:hypothetical protein
MAQHADTLLRIPLAWYSQMRETNSVYYDDTLLQTFFTFGVEYFPVTFKVA